MRLVVHESDREVLVRVFERFLVQADVVYEDEMAAIQRMLRQLGAAPERPVFGDGPTRHRVVL